MRKCMGVEYCKRMTLQRGLFVEAERRCRDLEQALLHGDTEYSLKLIRHLVQDLNFLTNKVILHKQNGATMVDKLDRLKLFLLQLQQESALPKNVARNTSQLAAFNREFEFGVKSRPNKCRSGRSIRYEQLKHKPLPAFYDNFRLCGREESQKAKRSKNKCEKRSRNDEDTETTLLDTEKYPEPDYVILPRNMFQGREKTTPAQRSSSDIAITTMICPDIKFANASSTEMQLDKKSSGSDRSTKVAKKENI